MCLSPAVRVCARHVCKKETYTGGVPPAVWGGGGEKDRGEEAEKRRREDGREIRGIERGRKAREDRREISERKIGLASGRTRLHIRPRVAKYIGRAMKARGRRTEPFLSFAPARGPELSRPSPRARVNTLHASVCAYVCVRAKGRSRGNRLCPIGTEPEPFALLRLSLSLFFLSHPEPYSFLLIFFLFALPDFFLRFFYFALFCSPSSLARLSFSLSSLVHTFSSLIFASIFFRL